MNLCAHHGQATDLRVGGILALPVVRAETGSGSTARATRLRSIIERADGITGDVTGRLEDDLLDVLSDAEDGLLRGLRGADDVLTAVQRVRLEDVLTVMREAGLDEAHDAFYGDYVDLLDPARDLMSAAGVREADAILDSAGFEAALAQRLDASDATFWDLKVERAPAESIWANLRRAVRGETLEDVVQRAVDAGEQTMGVAVREARTDMAAFDRWTHAEVADQADPTGERLLIGYMGPDDGIERPFCDVLNGYAFSREEFQQANNAQIGHPIDYGGGWNCRHRTVWFLAELLEQIGYRRGDSALIQLANARARSARKAKRK